MKYTFISTQATYSHINIALFKDNQCIASIEYQDSHASSHLILYFNDLLQKHHQTLEDLHFLAIDKGPGAFTSLRVALATVNGIAFTRKVGLIGVNGLDALIFDAQQSLSPDATITIVSLLNAYNNDVYYAILSRNCSPSHETGCIKIEALVAKLNDNCDNQKIIFTGNGFALHEGLIRTQLAYKYIIHHAQPTATAKAIGLLAMEQARQGIMPTYKLQPNYLKTQLFAVQRLF